ncbi:MAG: oxidoreductase [Phycisphaerae bacterium]|nr:oxidoreductase [Phycisphaerae bacterium]
MNEPAGAPLLLAPIQLRSVTLPARLVVAPMCQYMADDGIAQPWHSIHIGTLACGGFGLVTMEATAVLREGRITPHCLGLWSDEHERALAQVLRQVRAVAPDTPIGIQLAHAGRKASMHRPFLGGPRGVVAESDGGWQPVGPSPIAFGASTNGGAAASAVSAVGASAASAGAGSASSAAPARPAHPTPRELSIDELPGIAAAFVRAAERAARLGFDYCEVHAAHGYLLSSFLSPLSNQRQDRYGGDLESRMRFPLEVVERVREAWPQDRPLGVRFGGSDWSDDGWSISDACRFAAELVERGVDNLSVSTAGNAPVAPRSSPAWLAPHAKAIRDSIRDSIRDAGTSARAMPRADRNASECRAVVTAVGELEQPALAERVLADGAADLIAVARGALRDPRLPWRAARELGAAPRRVPPYAWALGS